MVESLSQSEPWLTPDALRQVLFGLIAAEQTARLKSGALGPESSLARVIKDMTSDQCNDLLLDEDTLGFDSLAMLDLILRVNRFFGLHQSGIEDYFLVRRRIGDWLDLIAEHRRLLNGDVTLTFDTSGSSGPPKHVGFRVATLAVEIDALCRGPLAQSDPGGRIIALVPPQHIYGFLFTCLLPSMTGSIVCDLHQGVPTKVFETARPGDIIIATPYIWGLLGRSGQRLCKGVIGVTSGGPTNRGTWTLCETAGLHQLIEIYGATETGGVGFRTGFDAPFRLLSHLTRHDDHVMRGEDRLDIQDVLEWSHDDTFEVKGRLDDVIQIGGVNVSPQYVAGVLSEIPGVFNVAVRHDAAHLRAFVVSADGLQNDAFQTHVRREIQARLDPVARPASLTFGSELPRNALGKSIDWI